MSRKKSKATIAALAAERKQLFEAQCELFADEFSERIADEYMGAIERARAEAKREMTLTIHAGLYGWMKEGMLVHGLTEFFIRALWPKYIENIPAEDYDAKHAEVRAALEAELRS